MHKGPFRRDTICISNIAFLLMSQECCCIQRANYLDRPAIWSNFSTWRYNIGGGSITVSPFACQVKSTFKIDDHVIRLQLEIVNDIIILVVCWQLMRKVYACLFSIHPYFEHIEYFFCSSSFFICIDYFLYFCYLLYYILHHILYYIYK